MVYNKIMAICNWLSECHDPKNEATRYATQGKGSPGVFIRSQLCTNLSMRIEGLQSNMGETIGVLVIRVYRLTNVGQLTNKDNECRGTSCTF